MGKDKVSGAPYQGHLINYVGICCNRTVNLGSFRNALLFSLYWIKLVEIINISLTRKMHLKSFQQYQWANILKLLNSKCSVHDIKIRFMQALCGECGRIWQHCKKRSTNLRLLDEKVDICFQHFTKFFKNLKFSVKWNFPCKDFEWSSVDTGFKY